MSFMKWVTLLIGVVGLTAWGDPIPDGTYQLIASEQRAVAGSTVYPREFSPPEHYTWDIKNVGPDRYKVVKGGVGHFVGEGAMFVESSCGAEPDEFEIFIDHSFQPSWVKEGVTGYRTKCPQFFFSQPLTTSYRIVGAGPGRLQANFIFNFDNYYIIQMFTFKKL